jgi:cell division protein FtsN
VLDETRTINSNINQCGINNTSGKNRDEFLLVDLEFSPPQQTKREETKTKREKERQQKNSSNKGKTASKTPQKSKNKAQRTKQRKKKKKQGHTKTTRKSQQRKKKTQGKRHRKNGSGFTLQLGCSVMQKAHVFVIVV